MDRSDDRKRPREGLLSRSKREELRKNALERRVVVEEDEEELLQLPNNRKRKGSIKDRLDWSDKVVVVEEEQEAETFIENKESLASLEKNYAKKLARPRMGMVADMVEAEKRWGKNPKRTIETFIPLTQSSVMLMSLPSYHFFLN